MSAKRRFFEPFSALPNMQKTCYNPEWKRVSFRYMGEGILKEGCRMKRWIASLLFVMCLFCAASGVAQTVSCPQAGFSLTLPDSFYEIPRSPVDDRNLVLQYSDGSLDLAVYVAFAGANNPFMILTGTETEFGPVTINGMSMQYARGFDEYGPYATYSWMRAQDAVTLYFVWSGSDDTALRLISEIMNTIVFN